MSLASSPPGRRERNKQQKLDRITAAASDLFAQFGVEEVTTQQIAEKADIGTGTLFLYAKTKGELLLLVQNAHYAQALQRGRKDAKSIQDPLEAVLAIVQPIVACNRLQVDNGRIYLREMVFGDPAEPRHAEALKIVAETEEAIASVLTRAHLTSPADAETTARIISAILFMSMAVGANTALSIDEIVRQIRVQISLLLPS